MKLSYYKPPFKKKDLNIFLMKEKEFEKKVYKYQSGKITFYNKRLTNIFLLNINSSENIRVEIYLNCTDESNPYKGDLRFKGKINRENFDIIMNAIK